MNNVKNMKRAAEARRIDEISRPVVSIFDSAYISRARAEGNRKRAHEARVQKAYRKARAFEQAAERDWRRTRVTFVALAAITVATVLANVWGLWGQYFG